MVNFDAASFVSLLEDAFSLDAKIELTVTEYGPHAFVYEVEQADIDEAESILNEAKVEYTTVESGKGLGLEVWTPD